MTSNNIIIVGGGASGALLAAQILASTFSTRVTVVEPRAELGRGVAYSTECREHLLNVPAKRMSAFADEPDHFLWWLNSRYGTLYNAQSFVRRWIYGDYLNAIVVDAAAKAATRFEHVRRHATGIETTSHGLLVHCADGEPIAGRACVLATGNAHGPGSVWREGALDSVGPHDRVAVIGSGLTAVDAVLGLREKGHRGRVTMVSRRGLLPHEHRPIPPSRATETIFAFNESRDVVRYMRRLRGKPRDWRPIADGVRPHTNDLWNALGPAEQRRFLRHVFPYWNVHRHRMAPEVTQKIARLLAGNSLEIVAARIAHISANVKPITVELVPRDSSAPSRIQVDRLIDCTGPRRDFRSSNDALYSGLFSAGLMTSAVSGEGIQTGVRGELVSADGATSRTIYAIGPVRFGTLLETTAIPEIRAQANDLARYLTTNGAVSTAL